MFIVSPSKNNALGSSLLPPYLGCGRVEDPCEVADLVGRAVCGQEAQLDGGPALRGQADTARVPLFQLSGRGERVRATAVRPHVRECHLYNIIFQSLTPLICIPRGIRRSVDMFLTLRVKRSIFNTDSNGSD
jgi:hypothetical protein